MIIIFLKIYVRGYEMSFASGKWLSSLDDLMVGMNLSFPSQTDGVVQTSLTGRRLIKILDGLYNRSSLPWHTMVCHGHPSLRAHSSALLPWMMVERHNMSALLKVYNLFVKILKAS